MEKYSHSIGLLILTIPPFCHKTKDLSQFHEEEMHYYNSSCGGNKYHWDSKLKGVVCTITRDCCQVGCGFLALSDTDALVL